MIDSMHAWSISQQNTIVPMIVAAILVMPLCGADEAKKADVLAVGQLLPPLSGDFLTGKKAILPAAAQNKVALLALGFSYNSRFSVEAWIERFRKEFGKTRDVVFFEIPMIGGAARLGRWFIDSGMRRGTPKELHENVITVYGGTDPWKKRLGHKDPDAAYLILIDREARIQWLHSGRFDEAQFGLLAECVKRLTSR